MARISHRQVELDFKTEFFEPLDPNKEIIQIAHTIDWDLVSDVYNESISQKDKNTNSKSARMAFGAVYLQQKYSYTDQELIEMIEMNPYFQYFIGLDSFQKECPFTQSTLVLFRKRLPLEKILYINEMSFSEDVTEEDESSDDDHLS